MNKKEIFKTGLIIYFSVTTFFIILCLNIINDLVATANGYKSDRNICRREYEELTNNYEKLEDKYNEISERK